MNKAIFIAAILSTGLFQASAAGEDRVEKHYPIIGNLSAIHETKIGTQVSGRVKNVFVQMGDRVKKGDVLIELDRVFLEIELKRQLALFDLAKAGYDETLADLQRLKPLWEKDPPSISKKSFEDAEIRARQKKAQLDQATAEIDNTRQRMLETQILAPYDGVIVKRNVDYGEAVTTMPAVIVAEIIDDSKLLFEFSLPQDLYEQVSSKTTKIILEIPGHQKKFEGTISVISPQLEKDTRTFLCQVRIDNDDKAIHPGSFVKGTVLITEPIQ